MNKIKLIILDFDGVLCSLKKAHFISLNQALSKIDAKFIISGEEHISIYDGLSTRKKLEMLISAKNFPEHQIENVFNWKQELTTQAIENTISYDENLAFTIIKLKADGYLLYVASNAIRQTIVNGLKKLGIYEFFDGIYSNEDVVQPKPNPSIYLKVMSEVGVGPRETLILEDSKNGRTAAAKSGAYVCAIDKTEDTNFDYIKSNIRRIEKNSAYTKYPASNLNIVIPMSGRGSRFKDMTQVPKPLIKMDGKPMIQWAIESLNIDANYIFIVQKEHYEQYKLDVLLKSIAPDCKIIQIDYITSGPASSVYLAKEFIDNDYPLLIANSDQVMDWDAGDFLYKMASSNADGGIITFKKMGDPKWSYCVVNNNGMISETAEKKPISNNASIGVYYFSKGSHFIMGYDKMVDEKDTTNTEYYVAPLYNHLIKAGKKIKNYTVDRFFPTGTPNDLQEFLKYIGK